MKIEQMNRQTAGQIQAALADAMAKVETDLGVKFEWRGGTLHTTSATLKLQVSECPILR